MVLLLQSQRQYVFEFDGSGRVTAVTMPSVARHTMYTHVSVGYIRNTYNPPESNASIIHDYSEDGRPQAVHCLGTGRRVIYKYGKLAKLSEIVYDSTAVTFGYDETAGVLKMVNLQSGGFSCTIRYRKMGPLIDKQIYRFSEEGMVNARFDYTYHDNSFRIASMKPVISETPLPVDLYRYDEISGKVRTTPLLAASANVAPPVHAVHPLSSPAGGALWKIRGDLLRHQSDHHHRRHDAEQALRHTRAHQGGPVRDLPLAHVLDDGAVRQHGAGGEAGAENRALRQHHSVSL